MKLKFPKSWSENAKRGLLKQWGEGNAVQYEAYLIGVKHYSSGAEACNCNLLKDENNDFHLVTVDRPNLAEDDSITAEISPRIRPAGWTLKKLQKIAKDKMYVELVGYLMLDTHHLRSGVPARIIDWEIHPVTSMKVCTSSVTDCKAGNGWQNLSDFPEP